MSPVLRARRPLVICGVDGSVTARHVVAWAVRAAASRAAGLRVVAAFDPPERSTGWSCAGAAGIVLPSTTEGGAPSAPSGRWRWPACTAAAPTCCSRC